MEGQFASFRVGVLGLVRQRILTLARHGGRSREIPDGDPTGKLYASLDHIGLASTAMESVNMNGKGYGSGENTSNLDVRRVSQGSHCLTVTSVHHGWYMSTPTAAPTFFERAFQNHSSRHFNYLGDIADDTMPEETDATLLPFDKAMLLLADPPPPKQASIVSSHAGWYHMGPQPETPMDLHDREADLTEEGDPLLGHALICKVFSSCTWEVHASTSISLTSVL